jgi:hypothetical protein
LIKVDIFILDIRPWRVPGEKDTEPFDQSAFSNANLSMQATSEMIAAKYVTGLAIETRVLDGTVLVLGFLTGKCKVKS